MEQGAQNRAYATATGGQPSLSHWFAAGDIFLARHLFATIETDFAAMFSRQMERLKRLDGRLGSDAVFQMPENEAAKIHRQRESLHADLSLLLAWRDYLDWLTDFHIQTMASQCRRQAKLEAENQRLHAALLESLERERAATDLAALICENRLTSQAQN